MEDSIYRLRHADILTLCVMGLLALGVVMVQSASMNATGALEVRLPSTFTPAVGTSFRIVDNLGSGPIFSGVFLHDTQGHILDHDGATLTANNGMIFAINYHGGTGNDVVLTRVSTSSALQASPTRILAAANAESDATDEFLRDEV